MAASHTHVRPVLLVVLPRRSRVDQAARGLAPLVECVPERRRAPSFVLVALTVRLVACSPLNVRGGGSHSRRASNPKQGAWSVPLVPGVGWDQRRQSYAWRGGSELCLRKPAENVPVPASRASTAKGAAPATGTCTPRRVCTRSTPCPRGRFNGDIGGTGIGSCDFSPRGKHVPAEVATEA
eukprot:3911979-Prymnesium_polylepis.1